MGFGQRFEIGDDGRAVDEFDLGARQSLRVQHHRIGIAEARFAVIVRSATDGTHGGTWFNDVE
jgi:hypothetical protein